MLGLKIFVGKNLKCSLSLEPTFVYAGAVLNVLAFCIWMFGPKSKYLCCATYFTANSIADFLLLTIIPFYHERGIIIIPYVKTDIVCKLLTCLCNSLLQVSTWVSASLTVDRALTIILPFVFKSQDIIKRSKYIVALIIVMQLITQILPLIYVGGDFVFCRYYDFDDFLRSLDFSFLCFYFQFEYKHLYTMFHKQRTCIHENLRQYKQDKQYH